MRRFVLSIFLAAGLTAALPALDISFNGRNMAVLDTDALAAFLPPGESSLPLGVLFPWLSSFEYLEARSEANRIWWDSETTGQEAWYAANLVRDNGEWELHMAGDVFSNPDRIEVTGIAIEVESLCVWSTSELPDLRRSLEMILDLKDVDLQWLPVADPAARMAGTDTANLPHLVISESPGGSGVPIAGRAWNWYYDGDEAGAGLPAVVAADAYRPEAALYYLMVSGGALFGGEGLSADLEAVLEWATASSEDGSLLVDPRPLELLASGEADAALLLPGDTAGEGFIPSPAPDGYPEAALPLYAAPPSELPETPAMEAGLLIGLLSRYGVAPSEATFNSDPRLPLFRDAWNRIARLVISGQMDVDEGIALMNRYIAGE